MQDAEVVNSENTYRQQEKIGITAIEDLKRKLAGVTRMRFFTDGSAAETEEANRQESGWGSVRLIWYGR